MFVDCKIESQNLDSHLIYEYYILGYINVIPQGF